MYEQLGRLTNARFVFAALALWLLTSGALFGLGPFSELKSAAGGSLPEEQFVYTSTAVQLSLERLGDTGRARYRVFQVLDALNAVITAIAFTALLGYLLPRAFPKQTRLRAIALLPVVFMLAEFVENSLLGYMALDFPHSVMPLAAVGSVATSIKLTLTLLIMIAVAGALLAWAVRTVRHRL